MYHRTVRDVMTRDVVRVMPATGFHEILALLTEYDITAVPVVDTDDRPVGIVSEADLMRTQSAQEDPSALFPPPPPEAEGPDRSGAATAQELMTSPAVCIAPDASVVAAARLMARHQIKRLPVVGGDGRLAGLVSRSDLLQVFLRDDQVIRQDIVEDVLGQVEGVSPAAVGVEVAQGRVVLSGTIDPPYLVPIVLRLCRSVDGVVTVTDRTDRPNKAVRPPLRRDPRGIAPMAGPRPET
ncbi:CBS domain-containing protein [Kitasatospora sp. MAP5-34]|uniref:CBS domain-containing protein n=1 Tax=Kitasatospora sp. MAP5-34 TaxID=3035102 RepID=UPI00247682B6|nr:CBS domain-containing protein [Kitasatospora sp. MAP5-34]MDH6574685.1 CBS-domain-containing membrane protein [Kitasatospora sp. MAP5-34]